MALSSLTMSRKLVFSMPFITVFLVVPILLSGTSSSATFILKTRLPLLALIPLSVLLKSL
jgi:hypothetical protein